MIKHNASRNEKRSVKFFDSYVKNGDATLAQSERIQSESYWEQPQHGRFEIVEADMQDFRRVLNAIWSENAVLQKMIEPLYELSQAVEEVSTESVEVSPFIYAMF